MGENYKIGKNYLHKSDFKNAILYFKKESDKTKFVLTDLGYTYMQINDFKNSLYYLDKAIELDNDFLYSNFNKCVLLNRLREYETVVTIGNKLIKLYPDYIQAYYELAVAYYNIERKKIKMDITKVLELCDKIISFNEINHLAYLLKGLAYYDIKDYQTGKDHYYRGLLNNPNMININEKIIELLKSTGPLNFSMEKEDLFDNEKILISNIMEKDKKQINDNLKILLNGLEKKYTSDRVSNIGGWQSPKSVNLLKIDYNNEILKNTIQAFELFILSNIKEYFKDKNNIFYELEVIWGNINRYEGYNNIHNHGINTLSGCYYVDSGYSDEKITPLIFYDNDKNEIIMEQLGKEGNLALWDSEIYHSVPKHMGDKPRMSIAFNVNVIFK
tara:strand:- start:2732 stop:3892 length:1161 start_codon:yes stop_codon:yes gene_type:complete